ncbi:MAG: M18 family aminopeptidase, partial [bacterium]
MNEALLNYIQSSPTAFHAVATTARMLEQAGFHPLSESGAWHLQTGEGYFVTRNNSSLIAFRIPANGVRSFMISASHCDSPCFKLRERAELISGEFVRLSCEGYGGMIWASWMDRPLSVAGRLLVRTEGGLKTVLVDMEEPLCLMPNVAIHMNRNMNKEANYNLSVDLQPLYGTHESAGTFRARVAEKAGVREEDIVTTDLFVYNPMRGVVWGDFLSAPRLDDLTCAFASTEALLSAEPGEAVPVSALFDNEEVGSRTKQGAASTFLRDTLTRLAAAFGVEGAEYDRAVAGSLMLSCDNAHALHPNHPEFADKNN